MAKNTDGGDPVIFKYILPEVYNQLYIETQSW
jgi:hypothetical protein